MPPDTQWARDLMTSIDRGDIEGGSFAFQVLPDGQKWNADGTQRTLTCIKVRRVSVVSDPAYLQTNGSFAVRSASEIRRDRFRATTDLLAGLDRALSGVVDRPSRPGVHRDPDLARRLRELDVALQRGAVPQRLRWLDLRTELKKLDAQIASDRRQVTLAVANAIHMAGLYQAPYKP